GIQCICCCVYNYCNWRDGMCVEWLYFFEKRSGMGCRRRHRCFRDMLSDLTPDLRPAMDRCVFDISVVLGNGRDCRFSDVLNADRTGGFAGVARYGTHPGQLYWLQHHHMQYPVVELAQPGGRDTIGIPIPCAGAITRTLGYVS